MSTESSNRTRVGVRGTGIVLVATCAASAVGAAEVNFRPVITFGVFRDGNIATVGGVHTDEFAALSVDFLVERTTPQTNFRFSYRPSYAAYNESQELNYFANTLVFNFVKTVTEVSRLNVDAFLARTDHQGQRAYAADIPTTFVPRTTETTGRLGTRGTVSAGPRGLFDWRARVDARAYEDLPDNPATTDEDHNGIPDPPDPIDFDNSVELALGGAWRYRYSERGSVGVFLDASAFEYEEAPGVVVGYVGVTGSYDTTRTLTFAYSVGGFRASSEGDQVSDVTVDAEIRYPINPTSSFNAGVRQTCSPGIGLGDTTKDRGGWLSYARAAEIRGFSATLLGSYWEREPLLSSLADSITKTAAVTGTIGWTFNRFLEMSGFYSYIDQSDDASASFNTSYSSYGIYLRWAIRGL